MKFYTASTILFTIAAASTTSCSAFTPNPPNAQKGSIEKANVDLTAPSLENFDLNAVTKLIYSKIDEAQLQKGEEPLSEEAKDEIIATAVAGSVVGTAVGSPLLIGAALGYAGSQMIQGEQAEKTRQAIGKASKDLLSQANAAVAFTAEQIENEKDLSSASKKILLAIQDRAEEVQNEFSSEKLVDGIQTNIKKTVESEEFKQLPNRTFNAVRTFLASDEVKQASNTAFQAIKDGLESDEMKALQNRASQVVNDTIKSKKN